MGRIMTKSMDALRFKGFNFDAHLSIKAYICLVKKKKEKIMCVYMWEASVEILFGF